MPVARKWTDEQLAVLRERVGREPFRCIAAELGVPAGVAYVQAIRLGLISPRSPLTTGKIRRMREMRDAGYSVTEIAVAVGVSPTTVSTHTKQSGAARLTRAARLRLLPGLHRGGVCLDALCAMFRVTPREAVALIRAAEGVA